MKDPIQKRVELWFRRILIPLLRWVFQRRNPPPVNIDFNGCKYLFIRQDRIGDVLISTPLMAVLKQHYPGATLDVLLSKNNYSILENDSIIRKRWMYQKKLGKVISLIRSLRNEQYDFLIDLMDNPSVTSTIFCLLSKAKWNVGIEKQNSFVYDIKVPMLSRKETHIIDRISQLLIPFHIDPLGEQYSIRYFTSAQSDEYADTIIRDSGMISYPIIGINISAGTDTRFWGVDNFKLLLNHLYETYPEYALILLYQPNDEQRAKEIVQLAKNLVIAPKTSTFDQFAALVKRLSFLVTPDTAAVHLASAFKIRSVVLYVQSDKSLRIWEPYGIDCECLVTDIDDISTISRNKVYAALDNLIQRAKKR
jgi:ADP-heptose:LPS heptosyltransferase